MKLVIVPAAVAELRDAAAFYAAQGSVSLANQFVDEFERAVNLIVASPHLGALFRGNWRRNFLRSGGDSRSPVIAVGQSIGASVNSHSATITRTVDSR